MSKQFIVDIVSRETFWDARCKVAHTQDNTTNFRLLVVGALNRICFLHRVFRAYIKGILLAMEDIAIIKIANGSKNILLLNLCDNIMS